MAYHCLLSRRPPLAEKVAPLSETEKFCCWYFRVRRGLSSIFVSTTCILSVSLFCLNNTVLNNFITVEYTNRNGLTRIQYTTLISLSRNTNNTYRQTRTYLSRNVWANIIYGSPISKVGKLCNLKYRTVTEFSIFKTILNNN